jgi:hypothetical protein
MIGTVPNRVEPPRLVHYLCSKTFVSVDAQYSKRFHLNPFKRLGRIAKFSDHHA